MNSDQKLSIVEIKSKQMEFIKNKNYELSAQKNIKQQTLSFISALKAAIEYRTFDFDKQFDIFINEHGQSLADISQETNFMTNNNE